MSGFDIFSNLNKICKSNILQGLEIKSPNIEAGSPDDHDILTDWSALPKGRIKRNLKKQSSKEVVENAQKKQETVEPVTVEMSEPKQAQRRSTRRSKSASSTVEEQTIQPVTADISKPRQTGRRTTRQSKTASTTVEDVITVPDFIEPTNAVATNNTGRVTRSKSKETARERRNRLAEQVARQQPVGFVDLIYSPIPHIEGVVNVDSDDNDENDEQKETVSSAIVPQNNENNSFDSENPEISVKFLWNGIFEIFQLRKYQKFSKIFDEIAEREKTSTSRIGLNLNNKIISPDDTPASINYKIFEFINGRVLSDTGTSVINQPQRKVRDVNRIKLMIQSDQWKKKKSMDMQKTDTFKILYIKCAEELNIAYESIRLSFDGDHLEYNGTPDDFEFEGGEVLDLAIKK